MNPVDLVDTFIGWHNLWWTLPPLAAITALIIYGHNQ